MPLVVKTEFIDADGDEASVDYDDINNRFQIDYVSLAATEEELNGYIDFIKSEFFRLVTKPKTTKTTTKTAKK